MQSIAHSSSPSRFLTLEGRPDRELSARQEWDLTQIDAIVRVQVREGSKRTEVVEALRGMLKLVEDRWADLIALAPAAEFQVSPYKKEGDHQEAKCTRPLEGREGAEALELTAA